MAWEHAGYWCIRLLRPKDKLAASRMDLFGLEVGIMIPMICLVVLLLIAAAVRVQLVLGRYCELAPSRVKPSQNRALELLPVITFERGRIKLLLRSVHGDPAS